MATWKEFLVEVGYENLEKARRLTDVTSADDPDDEPYKSLYEAREEIKNVLEKLKQFAEDQEILDEQLILTLASVELRMGMNYVETEEPSAGEEFIDRCLARLEKFQLDPRGMNVYHDALNQMGILWTGRQRPDKALEYLNKAESLYDEFKTKKGGAPWAIGEFLSKPDHENIDKLEHDRSVQLESTYTHTLFYCAQVHGQLDNRDLSAQYCHQTLQRQLDAPNFNSLEWSLQAATLSQYYMVERNFPLSRHCLASAEVIWHQAKANAEGRSADYKERLDQARADLHRCWAKYGLGLLESSKEKLLHEVEKMDENGENMSKNTDSQNGATAESEHGSAVSSDDKDFPKFNLEVSAHEGKIVDKPLNVFDEAREVFLFIQKSLNAAKEFYVLQDHCTDHVEIVQDHSMAFKCLSFFELDMERQCKMHKRRIDMLSELLKEVSLQYYLLICRQMIFEIADTYSTMLDLKLAILESSGARPTAHSIKKINTLTKESIQKYQEYLNTLKDGKPDLPAEFPENNVRPGLVAMFCMGRLYSKFILAELQPRIANVQKSMECYKFVVDYCDRNPSALPLVKSEYDVCVEMVGLLPVKMEKIRQQYK